MVIINNFILIRERKERLQVKIINIKIISFDGSELFSGLVTELPLEEEYIIAKSIERFNESEPCIIYRTHIGKIFYMELYEKLNYYRENGITKLPLSEVSIFFDNINLNTQEAYIIIN